MPGQILIPDAEVGATVVAERREQAALFASLSEQQWDAPSLCEGWRMREVPVTRSSLSRPGEP